MANDIRDRITDAIMQIEASQLAGNVPLPSPRPYEAGPRATEEEAAWAMMNEQQKLAERAKQQLLYEQIVGPNPLPRPRPPEADNYKYDANADWDTLSEPQKLARRREQIRLYNEMNIPR